MVKDREVWRTAVPWGHKKLDTTEPLNWTDILNKKVTVTQWGLYKYQPLLLVKHEVYELCKSHTKILFLIIMIMSNGM